MRSGTRALAWGSLLALAAFVLLRIRVTTDITHFLPSGRNDGDVRIARELASGEPSRTMVILVGAEDAATAVRAGRMLESALRQDPDVGPALAFLEGGPPDGLEEAVWELYQPRRLAFFAADAASVEEATTPDALRARVAILKRELALPTSSLLARVAPADPTLILPRLYERLAGRRGEGLGLRERRFVTSGGAAVVFLGTRASPSESSVQRPLLHGIRRAFDQVARGFDAPLTLSMTGANRFAVHAEASIRADIQRVSIGSSLGLALLFLLLFRSLRLALVVLPVVGTGFLAGTAVCLACFGSVHGLTLAFGAAMIGVSVDYAVHVYVHEAIAPHPDGPRATLSRLWPGLVLSAATTVVAFLVLAFSDFPGLREMGVFAATGIAAALLATRAFLPALVGRPRTSAVGRWLEARLESVWSPERRRSAWVPVLGAVALAVLGFPRLRWNDSIANLNRLDPDLAAEDAFVRSQVAGPDGRRMIVALGTDDEAGLAVNDRVADVLEQARRDGLLSSWRSLATLLPSAARQQAVADAVRAVPELWPCTESALRAEGFVVERFTPFRDALGTPAPPPLTFARLDASALAPLVRPFRVSLADGVGFISLVHGLHDEAALRERIAGVPGARWIDVEAVLSGAYGAYRTQMAWLFCFGLVAVLALVALRHRALRPTLVATVPAALAAAGTLGGLALAGVELNMLSLVAISMVVGMGVDYGVLLAEARDNSRARRSTLFSIVVAAVSTVLGFGLLVSSRQPALFGIGSTAALGVLACLVLTPAVGAIVAARSPSSPHPPP